MYLPISSLCGTKNRVVHSSFWHSLRSCVHGRRPAGDGNEARGGDNAGSDAAAGKVMPTDDWASSTETWKAANTQSTGVSPCTREMCGLGLNHEKVDIYLALYFLTQAQSIDQIFESIGHPLLLHCPHSRQPWILKASVCGLSGPWHFNTDNSLAQGKDRTACDGVRSSEGAYTLNFLVCYTVGTYYAQLLALIEDIPHALEAVVVALSVRMKTLCHQPRDLSFQHFAHLQE